MNILRVFPSRTSYTPTDDYVRIGQPDLLPLPDHIDEVHVSCCFSWEKDEAEVMAEAWRAVLPRTIVVVGGPAFDDPGARFVPGRYVKPGVSISSHGCPNKCAWCLVPEREGKLRLLPICPGWIVQDNAAAAWPRDHFRKLVEMLKGQRRAARFSGGLEARRLTDWHIDKLTSLRIKELWFAADTDADLKPLAKVAAKLADLRRDQKRCYVLAGFNGEAVDKAEARLDRVFDLGYMPFVQLYRSVDSTVGRFDTKEWSELRTKEWRELRRNWSRPIMVLARHAKAKERRRQSNDESGGGRD